MRETTQVSNKKIYGPYIGYMQKLEGRIIQYKPIAKMKGNIIIIKPDINTKNQKLISK